MDQIENQNIISDKKEIPGIWHVLLLIGLAALISLILAPLSIVLKDVEPLKDWVLFINYVITYSIVLFVSSKIWNIRQFDYTRVPFTVLLLLLPLVLSMLAVSEFIISFIPMPERFLRMFEQMIQLDFAGYLTVGIAAPILEEYIFRGVLLKAFLKKFSPKMAIFWSAFLFGIFHMNPWQFIPAFFIGLVIGWLYYKTKSLIPGLFIHFANNSISFLLAVNYQDIDVGFKDMVGNSLNYAVLLLGALLVGTAIILYLHKFFNKQQLA